MLKSLLVRLLDLALLVGAGPLGWGTEIAKSEHARTTPSVPR